ncbi:LysR family transcriptional regulator [Trinickia soli]|jgi:DNA-binding transcriptional LysR family regulator|uniref:LysR family transcriptional regulator n=1 Tax=Trinickia soli TaxID=380675 RepID=A0A2N7VR00_9BURK|nr:LysR family transcriptional regulator [Trinickia soli]KAA0084899.1 LysR family transcriptional regulator [Paraburkholderia sp. T12-10]PMS19557.1 LysR family transcriptional regulator [Trinickia soli]CAB3717512.1 HTH-type transcriptional regulator GbpR [Trinickia soli]
MRDIDLKTLRLFVAVCDLRNMARAAEEMHIEPSAISKRIAQLESDLGVPLLVRTRRGAHPTPAGIVLLEHARNALFTMERISTDVAGFKHGLVGSVTVCASASAIAEALLDDIASFLRAPEHENVKVSVDEQISLELVRRVRDGETSIGVCWDNVDLNGLMSRPYRQDHLALAVHPGHPLAKHRSVSLEQTLDYEHVGMPPSTAVHTTLRRAAAALGRNVSYRMVVSTFDATFRVVAANLGISVVPAIVGHTYARIFDMKIVPLTDAWAERRFAIFFKDYEALQPAAQRLVVHLAECAVASRPCA